jgi:hypothetical protein
MGHRHWEREERVEKEKLSPRRLKLENLTYFNCSFLCSSSFPRGWGFGGCWSGGTSCCLVLTLDSRDFIVFRLLASCWLSRWLNWRCRLHLNWSYWCWWLLFDFLLAWTFFLVLDAFHRTRRVQDAEDSTKWTCGDSND